MFWLLDSNYFGLDMVHWLVTWFHGISNDGNTFTNLISFVGFKKQTRERIYMYTYGKLAEHSFEAAPPPVGPRFLIILAMVRTSPSDVYIASRVRQKEVEALLLVSATWRAGRVRDAWPAPSRSIWAVEPSHLVDLM